MSKVFWNNFKFDHRLNIFLLNYIVWKNVENRFMPRVIEQLLALLRKKEEILMHFYKNCEFCTDSYSAN